MRFAPTVCSNSTSSLFSTTPDDFLSAGAGDDEEGDEKRDPFKRRAMEEYAKSPVPDATLLMRADTWRKGNLDKLIAKVGTVVECRELDMTKAADVATAVAWARARCAKRYECEIDEKAARLLVENAGASLLHLDAELLKLANFVGQGKAITSDAVGQLVGGDATKKPGKFSPRYSPAMRRQRCRSCAN
jgi:DNA polymerase III delta subunit